MDGQVKLFTPYCSKLMHLSLLIKILDLARLRACPKDGAQLGVLLSLDLSRLQILDYHQSVCVDKKNCLYLIAVS